MYIQTTKESKNDKTNAVAVIMSHCAENNSARPNFFPQYATLNGLTSGIPTRTTPTLTPTTLRNIEESFLDLQTIPPAPVEHHRQAGFVPPVINISTPVTCYSSDSNSSYASSMAVKQEEPQWLSSCMQSNGSSSGTNSTRKTGGRRAHRDDKLTPEEEERKRIRRERNKLAAARCRKRRMDHTNTLLVETEGLEEKRANLQSEIQLLTHQKEELEFLLEAHQPTCKFKGQLKSCSSKSSKENAGAVAVRPSSLAISNMYTLTKRKTPVSFPHSMPISTSTPSGGMFNFESLMDNETGFAQVSTGLTPVSTGLTPVRSSCADQQRYSNGDLSSPENVNPPKLVSL